MARVHRLTARRVRTAKVGKYCDGGGLWLVVRPSGSRAWVFRYTRNGRQREMGLGPVDVVSLAEARELARQARRLLLDGLDPIAERRSRQARTIPTFEECAEAFIDAHAPGWSNPKHRGQWRSTLRAYAYPVLGRVPVDEIDTPLVLKVLEPVWRTKPETAARLRGRIERILDWAKVRGYRSGENPARWRGHLQALLPPRSRVRPVRHHRALPWQQLPQFMVRLRRQPGIAARALEFTILTAARSGEVRGSTWAEVDLQAAVWTVPAERMKAGREHRVPLSAQAVELLRALPRLEGSPYVFPAPRGGPLSDMALTAVLRRMGVDATVHGFRSSFRDWCAECTAFPREVAEQALAHRIPDAVEAAYRRGDLFAKRRRLMEAWASYCTGPPAQGEVVPIRMADA